jgi:hypothetical protein
MMVCAAADSDSSFGFKSLFNVFTAEENDDASMSKPTTMNQPIYAGFRLPIEYLDKDKVFEVSDAVASDLELCPPQMDMDPSGNARMTKSMYEYLCCPKNRFSRQIIREIHRKYTTDVEYLTDTQTVLDRMGTCESKTANFSKTELAGFTPECSRFMDIWKEVKEDAGFMDRYSFIDFAMLEYLNHSSDFLQALSVVNILSPLFSLCIPFLFLLFPFLLLQLRGVPITFQQYVDTLREISKNHFIGKALNLRWDVESLMYFGITAGLYLLQTYQNVKSCYRYYVNITQMNDRLIYLKQSIRLSIFRMETFLAENAHVSSYREFRATTEKHVETLKALLTELDGVSPFCYSVQKACQIGYMLRCYYQIHTNKEYERAIRYAVGFDAYMDTLEGISRLVRDGYLGKAKFVDDAEPVFQEQYYPPHQTYGSANDGSFSSDTCVRNTCDLSLNMIITGVNASGKTTFLKTTAINVLVSQQFGVGFYRRSVLRPYTHIHSYLNIPDTSGRDSLFQAESRRCKEIIDRIETSSPESRHFCIFDELYSGTNPEEATQSAASLLRYLSKYSHVRFVLTTHYVSVCRKFRKSGVVQNYKMCVKVNEAGRMVYSYKLKKGISKIRGGMEILKQMNYPEEILRDLADTQK